MSNLELETISCMVRQMWLDSLDDALERRYELQEELASLNSVIREIEWELAHPHTHTTLDS